MPSVPINYEPDPTRRHAGDSRPLPARPASPTDHHDHKHFPFVEGNCRICDAQEQARRLLEQTGE